MKKTISISIGGYNYQIEEDAFGKLDKYLADVRAHFSSFPDSGEIVSDMEARMAEQFESKTGEQKIITLPMVEELVTIMGQPEQMGGGQKFDSTERESTKKETREAAQASKRLYRDKDEAILAGVASGLSSYLGLADPVWIRLLFAVSIFFGGLGILLYIVLWVIVPEADTDIQKMQMRGEPINIKNIEQTVKERVDELKKNPEPIKRPLRGLARMLAAIGRFLLLLVKIALKIVGLVLIVAAALIIAGLVFAVVSALFNINSPYVDFPLIQAVGHAGFYVAAVSGFFLALVPVVFLILLGASLVSNKSVFKKMSTISLFAIWVVAGAVFANVGIKYAPQIEDTVKNSPYYQNETRVIDEANFTKVSVNSAYAANITQGDAFKVTATGPQNELDRVQITNRDGQLVMEEKNLRICIFCIHRGVTFDVVMPKLDAVSASGASNVSAKGFDSESFNLNLSGTSKGDVEVSAQNLAVKLSGASKLVLKGPVSDTFGLNLSGASKADISASAKEFNADLSGSSKATIAGDIGALVLKSSGASQIMAKQAIITSVSANLSGSSQAYFSALNSLDIHASGASKAYYDSVKDLKTDLSGSSRVEKYSR
ncbi:MAG: GIN domain-containing protein [Acidobacteriaceae bacterium]